MSEYAYFACMTCSVQLSLGKAIKDDGKVHRFHRGGADDEGGPRDQLLCRASWKMMAEHVGHELRVHLEYSMPSGMRDIEEEFGSLADYVGDWPSVSVAAAASR